LKQHLNEGGKSMGRRLENKERESSIACVEKKKGERQLLDNSERGG